MIDKCPGVVQCQEEAPDNGTMLRKSAWRQHDAWNRHPMAAQCLELASNGGAMLRISAQWQCNAEKLGADGGPMLEIRVPWKPDAKNQRLMAM
jgi:hypothetical protein